MSDARGLDALLSLETDDKIIIPNKDVKIENFDKITCRIIKFGKKNQRDWKGDANSAPSTSTNLRIYLYVHEFHQASLGKPNPEYAETIITINPKVQWLGNLVAEQTKLAELTGNKEEIFRRKLVLRRADKKVADSTNTYGSIEVTDMNVDPTYNETQHTQVQSVDDETDGTKNIEPKTLPATTSQVNQQAKQEIKAAQEPTQKTAVTQKIVEKPAAPDKDNVVALLANAKTPEAAAESIKPAYNSIDKETAEGKAKRAEIMALYKSRKREIIKEMIAANDASTDLVEAANALCAKNYPKEGDKADADEVKRYAIHLSGVRKTNTSTGSDELDEDDVPF